MYFTENSGTSNQRNFNGANGNTQVNIGVEGTQTSHRNSGDNRVISLIECNSGRNFWKYENLNGNIRKVYCFNGIKSYAEDDQNIQHLINNRKDENLNFPIQIHFKIPSGYRNSYSHRYSHQTQRSSSYSYSTSVKFI